MKNIPCNIIRDLLILYEDDVCSQESKDMIEDHIAECEECKKLYQDIKKPFPSITLKKEDTDDGANTPPDAVDEMWEMARKAYKELERKLTFRRFVIIGVTIIILFTVYIFFGDALSWIIYGISPEDITVTELYELESGDIYCTLKSDKPIGFSTLSGLNVPDNKQDENYDAGWYNVSLRSPTLLSGGDAVDFGKTQHFVFPKKYVEPRDDAIDENGDGNYAASDLITHTCTTIYYGASTKGFDEKKDLLIWKDGMDIEPAPQSVEKRVKEEFEHEELIERLNGAIDYDISYDSLMRTPTVF